jgi:hypothetical protein
MGISDEGVHNMKNVACDLLNKLEKKENISGLLYGRVQSGKTNSMIMSIANIIDSNQYKLFIVLTSDNTSLYNQTLSRITSGLKSIGVIGYRDIANGNENEENIKTKLGHSGAVIVCTKNPKNLNTLNKFLQKLRLSSIGTIIFDDEADFGSLNSKQNREEQSAVYKLIEALREITPDTKFIEVTATPQANLLQKPEDPRYPKFIIQIPPGDGYVGGDRLYDLQDPNVSAVHHVVIDESEIKSIMDENVPPTDAPKSIYKALCTFFISGAMEYITSPNQSNFSMLVHISARKSVNNRLYELVNSARNNISKAIYGETEESSIDSCLRESFENVRATIKGGTKITYDEVLEKVKDFIDQSKPQKIISGKANDEPSYNAFYNILIGGNRLSRGLTVENLTVFYYARVTGAPKVDTILQHSRVYGYRERILDIIRIFSTAKIFDYLYDVYMSDQEEWEYVKNGAYLTGPPVLLSLRKTRSVRPTRPQVVPTSNLLKYFPGKTYFMYDAKASNVKEIDELLKEKKELTKPEEIDHELAQRLIGLTDTNKPNQRWNKEAIKTVLSEMHRRGQKIYLIVRKESDLAKGYRAVLSGQMEDSIWKEDGPIIFMYRTSGRGLGWNNEIAWIPVLRMPVKSSAYYLSGSETVGNLGEE